MENLNLQIAKIKSLDISQSPAGYCIDKEYNSVALLDYINDPKLILELQMELLANSIIPDYDTVTNQFYYFSSHTVFTKHEHFGTATGLAYIEMRNEL